MANQFVWLSSFARSWKRLKLTERDWEALRAALTADPRAGSVVPGGGGARKLRFAPPSWRRGKSGATRVVYIYMEIGDTAYMIVIYAKGEQENVTAAELRAFREAIERLKREKQEEP